MKHPHPFQQTAQQQINAALNACRNPVYCAPCRTGKTFVACNVAVDRIKFKELIIVLTPTGEIFDQWVIAATEAGIDYGTVCDGRIMGRNKLFYICMPLTLANMLSQLPAFFYPDLIITDETHHSKAYTWENIYSFFEKARRLGLTATLKRPDGQPFTKIYDIKIETIKPQEAVDKKYLSIPAIIAPEEYYKNIDIPIVGDDYDLEYQAQVLGDHKIIGNVINLYSEGLCGLPTMFACCTYEHAEQMTEEMQKAGWNWAHLHSELPYSERKSIVRKIRNGELNGISTVGIGIEGFDIPGLYGLFWLCRTMSIVKFIQFTYRALTPCDGKKYGMIYDLVGNIFIHGDPIAYRNYTIDGGILKDPSDPYDAPKMKLCPQCKVMNSEQNTKCHICGYDFVKGELSAGKKRGFPAMEDGRVVLLDDGDLAQRKAEIQEALRKQREVKNAKEEKEKQLTELNRLDKIQLLKTGFENKSGLFADAVRRL